MLTRKIIATCSVVTLLFPLWAGAQEIKVAAAADLQFALQDLAARFEKETGKVVRLTFGSSGNFFAQLQNGAPFDLFFSANLDYPKKLEVAGVTEPGSYYEYATGKIVIWVPNDSKLDISVGLQSLLNPAIKKLAIANPQHAPYGQAAVSRLKEREYLRQRFGEVCAWEIFLRPPPSSYRAQPTWGLLRLLWRWDRT